MKNWIAFVIIATVVAVFLVDYHLEHRANTRFIIKKITTFAVVIFCVGALIYISFKNYSPGSPELSNDAEKTMSWSEAVVYCQDLHENGHSDWKLPKTHELAALSKIGGSYWASDSTADIKKERVNDEEKAWSYDFNSRERFYAFVSTKMRVVCARNMPELKEKNDGEDVPSAVEVPLQNPQDEKACETVKEISKKENNAESWWFYLEKFPDGACADEAKQAINEFMMMKAKEEAEAFERAKELEAAKAEEKAAAEKAREQEFYKKTKDINTRAAWEKYLREFPDGENRFEAEYYKSKKVRGLEWSDLSQDKMSWTEAVNYCKNLNKDGESGWRLPDIDELKTLIKSCSRDSKSSPTQTQGKSTDGTLKTRKPKCEVSEKNNRLSKRDYSSACRCDKAYSELGDDDNIFLWSSSIRSDNTDYAWYVGFNHGHVNNNFKIKSKSNHVRCVR